ncbi:hypothetical protein ACVINI_001833 [Rhizobium beringeri]|jgi:hypothetical protein
MRKLKVLERPSASYWSRGALVCSPNVAPAPCDVGAPHGFETGLA